MKSVIAILVVFTLTLVGAAYCDTPFKCVVVYALGVIVGLLVVILSTINRLSDRN